MPRLKKKVHRVRPGVRALKEIKRLQAEHHPLISKLPFIRLSREIIETHARESKSKDLRIQPTALQALQEGAEYYMMTLFQQSNDTAIQAKRKTIMTRDVDFVRKIRG